MARTAKNEKALTPEEKLAQALVPDVEQPYRVPENWCWVVQGQVSAFCNGRAYKQAELLEDETKTPVLRVGNLFTNTSWYYSDLKLDENKYIDNEDLTERLKPIFYNNEDDVEIFLKEIKGMPPNDITDLVNRWVKEKRISNYGNSRKGDLWTMLNDAGLYSKSRQNWCRRVY